MLRTQPESVAASGVHFGRRLVGGWTLDLKPRVKRNVVPTGSGAESLELQSDQSSSAPDADFGVDFTIVVRGGDICLPDVCERFHLALRGGSDSPARRAALAESLAIPPTGPYQGSGVHRVRPPSRGP